MISVSLCVLGVLDGEYVSNDFTTEARRSTETLSRRKFHLAEFRSLAIYPDAISTIADRSSEFTQPFTRAMAPVSDPI